MPSVSLCDWRPVEDRLAARAEGVQFTPFERKANIERLVTMLIAHEVGHALGLRHNFKGSLIEPSSSVMDYNFYPDPAFLLDGPQAYDRAAIRYLYGLDAALPEQPFCTDQDTLVDPYCERYDRFSDPLNEDRGPTYRAQLRAYLEGTRLSPPSDSALNRLLGFVREGATSDIRMQALGYALDGLTVGTPVPAGADGGYRWRVDAMARRVFARLFLDAEELRGNITFTPSTSDVRGVLIAELRNNVVNTDGLRSFPTRRVAVDALKAMQTNRALGALLEAREDLQASLFNLTENRRNLTLDLIARIDAALSPYFVN